MSAALDDLTGMQFYRLRVVSRAENYRSPCGSTGTRWNCVCKCGWELQVTGTALRSGQTKSCGCYRRDRIIRFNRQRWALKGGAGA